MKVLSVAFVMIVIITSFSLVYFFRPLIALTNEPVYASGTEFDEHWVVYSVDVNGENVTVGEIGFTWELNFAGNTSEYDYYELTLHERVRGSAADLDEAGWIEGGQTLIDLRSDNLMVREWSETHSNGVDQVTTSTDTEWNGSIYWKFGVLFDFGSFNYKATTNEINFTISIRAIHCADVNLTIYGFSDWSIYGYSFDRILIRGTETIVINMPSQSKA